MSFLSRLMIPVLLASAPVFAQVATMEDVEALDVVRAAELQSKTVRLLAWNLEHFVDPYDNAYVTNEMEDGAGLKSDETLKLMALAIKEIDADVITFTEVESDRALKLFLDTYYPGHEYKYYACVPAIDWYQNVAVVSKFPLGPMTSFREVEITSSVDGRVRNDINNRLLTVEVKPSDDYSFLMVCLHLKAGRGPANVDWRKQQIGLVHDFLAEENKINPERNIVVLGDMNFFPNSEEFAVMTRGGEVKLHAPFEQWGFPVTHPGLNNHIDHIFFNDNMIKEYVQDSVSVARPLSHRELLSISDHLPTIASIVAEDQ